jgi:hypothetical protein
MVRQILAQVMFLNPNDLNRGSAELIEHDFDVEPDDLIDDYSPAVWVNARTLSELDNSGFFNWVRTIVEPLGGDVLEAGLATTPTAPSWAVAASRHRRAQSPQATLAAVSTAACGSAL